MVPSITNKQDEGYYTTGLKIFNECFSIEPLILLNRQCKDTSLAGFTAHKKYAHKKSHKDRYKKYILNGCSKHLQHSSHNNIQGSATHMTIEDFGGIF